MTLYILEINKATEKAFRLNVKEKGMRNIDKTKGRD
jgi:hypothetical protein